jgi:hypothetical protein
MLFLFYIFFQSSCCEYNMFFYSFFQEVTQVGSHPVTIVFWMFKRVGLLLRSVHTWYDKLLNMTTITISFAEFHFLYRNMNLLILPMKLFAMSFHSCTCTVGIDCLTQVPNASIVIMRDSLTETTS